MTSLTKLLAGMILAFSLLTTAQADSINYTVDQFANYQSDTPVIDTPETDEEGKKKPEGEEEEPDC